MNNNKSKMFMIFGILILIITLIVSSTYAWYVWTTNEDETIKIVTGSVSAKVTFKGGADISDNLRPVSDKSKGIVKNITIKSDVEGLTFNLYLDIVSLTEELKHTSFKYALYSGDTEKISGNFANYTAVTCTQNNTSHIVLLSEEPINTVTTTYTLYIWIDGNEVNPSDMMNKTFIFTLHADGEGAVLGDSKSKSEKTLLRLNALNSTIAVDISKTPDFSKISGESGTKYVNNSSSAVSGDGTKGIYTAEDDDGISYYFRGAVGNNYVSFAGFIWRIIRINGDGSVRMIYAGTTALANGTSSSNLAIGTSAYNSSYNDNAYVGYMYGTAGSSSYESTHKNTNNSTIKTYIDNWYKTNLLSYADYIEDTIYCNDRSVVQLGTIGSNTYNGNGIGTTVTAYGSMARNYVGINVSATPSLKCINDNDKFTVSSEKGNGALTYPIALITGDEAILAGAKGYDFSTSSYITNTSNYLYSGNYYWTMSPRAFAGGDSKVGIVNDGGYLSSGYSDGTNSARPVVSLKSDAISGGQGTQASPFTVG